MNTKFNHFLKCGAEDCFENNRFQNNFENGSVDHVFYRGVSIEQRPETISVFDDLINHIRPSNIIEIGTAHGGLTLALKDIADNIKLSTNIYTYDIIKPEYLIEQIKFRNLQNIYVRVKNLFHHNYESFIDEQAKAEIENIIKSDGACLVLCDGARKSQEFNLVSPILKQYDIIMAHDYSPSHDYFIQHTLNKVWNWHEIKDSDIETSVKSCGLKPFYKNEFLSVAWTCYIKD